MQCYPLFQASSLRHGEAQQHCQTCPSHFLSLLTALSRTTEFTSSGAHQLRSNAVFFSLTSASGRARVLLQAQCMKPATPATVQAVGNNPRLHTPIRYWVAGIGPLAAGYPQFQIAACVQLMLPNPTIQPLPPRRSSLLPLNQTAWHTMVPLQQRRRIGAYSRWTVAQCQILFQTSPT